MEKMWNDFDDFELAQLCFDYGIQDECQFSDIIPVTLSNRKFIEELLTEIELDMAFSEEIQ